jgi:L-ascorbate metabolism protein UlaG (beta-lactamase superfamily)
MKLYLLVAIPLIMSSSIFAQGALEVDVIPTSAGDLKITFIGHATMAFNYGGKSIHIDPVAEQIDYASWAKADIILITHHHGDHCDAEAIKQLRGDDTRIVHTKKCAAIVEGGIVMENGDVKTVDGLTIEAIPAYNLVHTRDTGKPFHPKGEGNSYVITFGDKRIYIGGDTENTPEMKALEAIDIAFLPMNLPYTMTPEMVADAVLAFKPKILYPYHTGRTNISKLTELLSDYPEIEVRVRDMTYKRQ